MSIAFDNVTNCARIGGSGFLHGNGPPGGSRFGPGDHRHGPSSDSCSRSSASSIGENSDGSSRSSTVGDDTTEEVQSPYRGGEGEGGSFSSMNALEEVLPIRRGISRFYNGKSKSFTSLLDSSTSGSSVRDIAKPENAYTRRRRNLLATGVAWDKNRTTSPLRSNGAGTFKRIAKLSRSNLALAISMTNNGPDQSCDISRMNADFFTSYPAKLSSSLQDARDFSGYRSFSVADLHRFCAGPSLAPVHHLLTKPQEQSEKQS